MKKYIKWVVGTVLCLILFIGYNYTYRLPQGEVITKKDDKIVIFILAGQSSTDAGTDDMINEVLKEKFENIEFVWECVDWGEQFSSQMKGKFTTGNIPDIMIGKAQDIFAYAGTDNLAPIPEECLSYINQAALDTVTIDSVTYGLPYNTIYQGVIYNKSIFDEYDLQVPKTLEELDHIVHKLEQNNIIPFAAHFKESWPVGNITMQFMENEIFNRKPNWGDELRAGEASFTGNNAINQCMQNSMDILNHTWDDALIIDQNESDIRFVKGEAAMYLTGTWSLQFASQINSDIQLGIFPYPNQTGDAKLIVETNMTFMKSSKTEYSEIIDEIFIELATNDKLAKEIMEFTVNNSTLKNVEKMTSGFLQEDIGYYANNNQTIDAIIGNSQLVWSYQNAISEKVLEWLQGKITLEDVLQYADDNIVYSKVY